MTIAFSTKSLDWKTEYSFEPLHYARSGNDLVSFFRSEDEAGVHLHDSSDEYNKFYENAYPSKLSVITNNNPSATKIYEAFSFEATKGGWSTKFTTETGEKQEGSVVPEKLVEREGKFYSSVPKNELNLDAVTKLAGVSTLGEIGKQKIKLSTRLFSMPPSYFGFLVPNSTTELILDLNLGQDVVIVTNLEEDSLGEIFVIKNVGGGIFDIGKPTSVSDVYSWALADLIPFFDGYDPYSQSLEINDQYLGFLDPFRDGVAEYLGITAEDMDVLKDYPIYIYSIYSIDQNGEDMRGEFMKIDIERSGTDYYELFAINVDQHQTKLDHSLGQNN